MNKVVRWNRVDPINIFDELERAFNRPAPRWNNEWGVAVDVLENEDGYVVTASLPGLAPEDVEVTLEDNVLAIKGEVKAEESQEGETYHVRERRYGSFNRKIRFPVMVNSDSVEAGYENGILTLTVPKADEVKPRRIEIKAS